MTSPIHELFQETASVHGPEVAIEHGRRQVAYRDLAGRANRLGNLLGEAAAAPGAPVGLLLRDPADTVAAVLGTLQAGCAFALLDPRVPPARLREMTAEAGLRWFIAEEDLLPLLGRIAPEGERPRVVLTGDAPADPAAGMDLLAAGSGGTDLAGPSVARDGDSLAYVFFTSGSTGRPKGIAGRLKAIDHFVRWEIGLLGAARTTRVSQLISPSFDAWLRDVFVPLCCGGTSCVPEDREALFEPGRLARWLTEERIEVVHCVPSLFRTLLGRRASPAELASLRWLLLSGEPLLPIDVQRWAETYGTGTQLVNLYGPSETTMTKLFYLVQPGDAGRESIPIGKPMPGARAVVLDGKGRPCAPGVAGEIYIRTPYRALGYLNRPDLDREVFVPNPLTGNPEDIVYRTGDFGRVLDDGNFEFRGRRDSQVKIRGVRIDLREIEGLLLSHPEVREAAVVDREDTPGDRYLCAYVVGLGAGRLDALRELCGSSLPEAMVPACFETLESLPRTLSGKLDRRALPKPSRTAAEDRPCIAPRDAFEEMVAAAWHELLGIRQIGIHDNFFRSGGHSLSATQLVSRLRDTTGLEIPLRILFENPTVAGLAARIQQVLRGEEAGAAPPPLERVPRDRELPLSFAQQRLWLIHQLDPQSPAYNMPLALRLRGPLAPESLAWCLGELVRRHEALRTTFHESAEPPFEPVQEVAPWAPVPLPVLDLSAAPPEERERLAREEAAEEARRPFSLATGPLLRARLLRLAADDHVVLFTLHHIVADGWSLGVLVREISALYRSWREGGRRTPLPELAVQYADFAVWQRHCLDGEALERELDVWTRRLAGEIPALRIPAARPEPGRWSGRGERSPFTLSPEVAGALRELGQRAGATLFMTLAAAFRLLLYRETGQPDLLLGTEIANRTRSELEPLIGFFVNMLALRIDLRGNPTFLDFLARVRETTLEAYSHQDLPFEKLVEHVQPERRLGRFPLFQAVLVLQNANDSRLDLPGLEISPFGAGSETAKFDLLLMLWEKDGGGLAGSWTYSTDLYDSSLIERLSRDFAALCASAAARPEERLNALTGRPEPAMGDQPVKTRKREKMSFAEFLEVEQEAVALSAESLVEAGPLAPSLSMPLVIAPAAEPVDLLAWTEKNRARIESDLASYGAILFRNFGVSAIQDFERFAASLCGDLFGEYGDLPQEKGGEKVYRSTPYPPEKTILFHNESSQMHRWPMKQWFYCVQAARQGGETPIVDCRKLYSLLDPEIRDRFERKGLMYIRNFTDGLDVSWQEFYRTAEKAAVEELCSRAGTRFEWTASGLRTCQLAPAVARHPRTGEKVFFNQLQIFHPSSLGPEVRRSMIDLFGEDHLPRDVRYGDGEPIEDELVEEITRLYWETAVDFPWREGDILMVDNMLTAHARKPFSGPRKIVVAMGDMMSIEEVV